MELDVHDALRVGVAEVVLGLGVHLNDDLGEKTDVAEKYPEKTTEMATLLEKIKRDGKTRF